MIFRSTNVTGLRILGTYFRKSCM